MKFYVEIGTINGYFQYKVEGKNLRDAAINALKLHKSKGRRIRENDVVKVFDNKTNSVKTFIPA